MFKTEEYYQSLILDYLEGELNEKRAAELWEWVQAEEAHVLLFKQWVKVYHATRVAGQWSAIQGQSVRETVFARLQAETPKKRARFRTLYRGMCAAAVALLISLTWFGLRLHFGPENEDTPVEYAEKITSSEFKGAVLVTGGKETLILTGKDSLSIPSTTGQTIHIANNGLIDYSELLQGESEKLAPQHSLKIPRGSEFCITLNDGTRVWLNALSELSYPEYFSGEKREVTLTGEAYFEVMPDHTHPFIVHTADMNLEVLGTSFNIRAYGEEDCLTTTLASGKIRQLYPASGDTLLLFPNEQSVYDKKQQRLQVQEADLTAALAWKEGRILLRNSTLDEIFRELNRWYDFEVSYQNERLKNMRFYLNIDRYANVESVLEKLQRTGGIQFIIQGKKIMVCNDVNNL